MTRTNVVRAVAAVLALALAVGVALIVGPRSWPIQLGGPDTSAPTGTRTSAPTPSPTATPSPDPTDAPAVLDALAELGADDAPTAAGLSAALSALLADPALGTAVGVAIARPDSAAGPGGADTGGLLLDSGADVPLVPASTAKILTGVAALTALGPDSRFTTSVEQPAPGRIVLVGGGDPALSQRPLDDDGSWAYPVTTLEELARRTAEVLLEAGTSTVSLGYRADLFTGPGVSPDWEPGYVSSGQVGPVSALSLDGSRERPGFANRVADPAAYTAQRFAELLAPLGIAVTGPPAVAASGESGVQLAALRSPTVADLVAQMLLRSDNDGAEVLAHHVARAEGEEASFAGARVAVPAVLERLGLPTADLVLRDGSGLSRGNRVAASTIVEALSLAFDPDHPRLRSVLGGLPVAGFSGTLTERFDDPGSSAQVGDVRAKTGYLTGAVTLAGYVLDEDDRPLVFAVLANGMDRTQALDAQQAVDRLAAAIAACGCD